MAQTKLNSVLTDYTTSLTRRHFFSKTSLGLGSAALASLMGPKPQALAGSVPGRGDLPHFAPKAKRAIYLFMSGAPSQIDLWDYKPAMNDWYDKDLPESIRQGQRLTTMTSGQSRFPIAPSIYKFHQHGEAGTWVSELLPYTAQKVDKLSLVRSVWTEAINHDPAITYICTGSQLPGKASLGSWLSYGLGTENADLPAFIVMTATWSGKKGAQALYNRLWGSGFLPSKYQGVALRSQGDPVLYLSNPEGVSPAHRRSMLDTLQQFNQRTLDNFSDPETSARIAQYEMAFKMQSSVPELTDLSGEPKSVLDLYGAEALTPGTFSNCCLRARRMTERGVRFVQVFHRGWDQHGSVPKEIPGQARDIDQAAAALLTDLEQRGLLEETLVVWGGEFGRTIYSQGTLTKETYGRDHHPRCFSIWMAGGGIKGGVVHGETDDFSYNIVKDPVHIRDMNATILNRLGIDHERFTFPFQGLDQRLTGVEPAKPIDAIMM